MLNLLLPPVRGMLAATLILLNTVCWIPVLLFFAILKWVIPVKRMRLTVDPLLLRIAETWIGCNSGWMQLTQATRWDVQGIEGLSCRDWYLVSCNHQSWVDILVLQHVFNRRIPMLKFFVKQQLIWVPLMGLAWWALDFPVMRRHSQEFLKKHPEMRAKDLATTRQACQKFALIPTSVMNFLEGTRFTPNKHRQQSSPYRHLLKPKAGGVALALNVMGDKFRAILDVTIVYPDGPPNFWAFLSGRVKHIIVRVRPLPLPQHLVQADYANDPAVRQAYQQWLHQIWLDKDAQIESLLHPPGTIDMPFVQPVPATE